VACLLLLASNSPRRRELLSAAGFEFEAVAPKISERTDIDLTVRELTALNAMRKGRAVARAHPDRIILSADTLVRLNDRVIGKPRDREDATEILHLLSGKVHEVCSAVFILHLVRAKSAMFHEVSQVRFRSLNRRAIDEYLAKVNPLDKAGAYAAQGHGSEIIDAIRGSYTNVVGLPMEKTTATLTEFGVKPINA
jgi:nucleoside triphosphate pyrophosphatase